MRLAKLSVKDFRCYDSVEEIPFDSLTIFIGENDIGKTVILDAVQHLITSQASSPHEFRKISDTEQVDSFVLEGIFCLDAHDTIPSEFQTSQGREFRLKKTISRITGSTSEVFCSAFQDPRFDMFPTQTATVQKDLLTELGIEPGSNGSIRVQQFNEADQQGTIARVDRFRPVIFKDIEAHLPKFFCTSSADYKSPDVVIQKTLQEVVDLTLRPPVGDQRSEISQLEPVRQIIQRALDAKIEIIEQKVRASLPDLRALKVEPTIEFSRSVTSTSLQVDTGEGFRTIEALGEGNKKKLWMGLLEWQRASVEAEGELNAIRAYDEPDVNLHFEAQRKLYSSIVAPANAPNSRAQVIIATHSVQLIDRAPVQSINLIRMGNTVLREIISIRGDTDNDYRGFFNVVAQSIGLTNSALFYERAFLVVEGPSEENALPRMYVNLFGHPMIHDGIILLNLEGCGSWRSILRVLQRNKEQQTIMLLDQDCTSPNSSGYISLESLSEVGYSASFKQDNCLYIGIKEFEDAFADGDILAVLNTEFPKQDGSLWIASHLPNRNGGGKFSEELLRQVKTEAVPTTRQKAKKPTFAEMLASHCNTSAQIPTKIWDAFEKVRRISGVSG